NSKTHNCSTTDKRGIAALSAFLVVRFSDVSMSPVKDLESKEPLDMGPLRSNQIMLWLDLPLWYSA
ncbi:MAG: hypothetical protein QF507_06960, partial [Vicinamibacterales bacterium]|nr:hypothetical protein [Vicinamibacterales bacterium]